MSKTGPEDVGEPLDPITPEVESAVADWASVWGGKWQILRTDKERSAVSRRYAPDGCVVVAVSFDAKVCLYAPLDEIAAGTPHLNGVDWKPPVILPDPAIEVREVEVERVVIVEKKIAVPVLDDVLVHALDEALALGDSLRGHLEEEREKVEELRAQRNRARWLLAAVVLVGTAAVCLRPSAAPDEAHTKPSSPLPAVRPPVQQDAKQLPVAPEPHPVVALPNVQPQPFEPRWQNSAIADAERRFDTFVGEHDIAVVLYGVGPQDFGRGQYAFIGGKVLYADERGHHVLPDSGKTMHFGRDSQGSLSPVTSEVSIQKERLFQGPDPGMPAMRITGSAAMLMQKHGISFLPGQRLLSFPDPTVEGARQPVDIPKKVELVTVRQDDEESLIIEFVSALEPWRVMGFAVDRFGKWMPLKSKSASGERKQPVP